MKTVKMASVLTLIALTAITLYTTEKAKRICEETAAKYEELTRRLRDIKVSFNALSEHIHSHRSRLSEIMEIAEARTAEKLIEEIECV